MDQDPRVIVLEEDRFARFRAIGWWRQEVLARAKVLVVGAGALGNEVIKNLALLGVGNLAIVDMDRIEASNLSRSVLFTEADEGRPKAVAAAEAARRIYPSLRAIPIQGNLLAEVGLGWFRWADVVVGALDNREARVFVNSAAARTGRPWIDGGIDVLSGIVRGFAPPVTACYECTMGQADWDLLAKRRSCSLLARRAASAGGTPTTPTTASVIGAIQAQEVVKRLHGMEALAGRGFVFEGLSHQSYTVDYPISPDCPWHEPAAPIEAMSDVDWDTPLGAVRGRAMTALGGLDALDLSREIVESLSCPRCGKSSEVFRPLDLLTAEDAACPACGGERVPAFVHSLGAESRLWAKSARQIGLPRWDVAWARFGERMVGYEMNDQCLML